MEISSTQYAPGHVLEIIKSLGVHHFNESGDQIPFYCPFHNNIHTPSCSINEASGAWICFNPSCGQSGTLIELVKGVMHVNDYQAIRFIASKEKQIEDNLDIENKINDLIFAVGMYAAMSKGTIGMMRRLATQSGVYVPEPETPTDPVNPDPNVQQDTIK